LVVAFRLARDRLQTDLPVLLFLELGAFVLQLLVPSLKLLYFFHCPVMVPLLVFQRILKHLAALLCHLEFQVKDLDLRFLFIDKNLLLVDSLCILLCSFWVLNVRELA
jgi:hypothetical protein